MLLIFDIHLAKASSYKLTEPLKPTRTLCSVDELYFSGPEHPKKHEWPNDYWISVYKNLHQESHKGM